MEKKKQLGAWLTEKKKQLDGVEDARTGRTKIAIGSASLGGGGTFHNFLLKGKLAHS